MDLPENKPESMLHFAMDGLLVIAVLGPLYLIFMAVGLSVVPFAQWCVLRMNYSALEIEELNLQVVQTRPELVVSNGDYLYYDSVLILIVITLGSSIAAILLTILAAVQIDLYFFQGRGRAYLGHRYEKAMSVR